IVPVPTPVPQPTPPPTPPPIVKNTPPKPTPAPTADPASALHKEQRKIEGSGPAGENGVDAVATERGKYVRMMKLIANSRWEPAAAVSESGKYKKTMKLLVEARWVPAIRARISDITPGTVACQYTIDAKGALTKFAVTSNTSSAAHAKIVEDAMRAAKFTPPP